jgi:glycine/D-amino acid oxidase-like deaminating enzyme
MSGSRLRFDVAVIGAGVHGASAAYHLARRGARTVVLERAFPASGPTGLSSAICRAYYTNAFLAEVARDSISMLADLPAHANGRDGGFRRTGFLYLHPEADTDAVRSTVERLSRQGIAVDLLDIDAIRREMPGIDAEGVGIGAFERDAGHADPVLTTTALLAAAADAGAEVRARTTVTGLRVRPAGGVAVRLADGPVIGADRVLIAAGPWSAPLAALVGAVLPLTVERHVVAVADWGPVRPWPFIHADVGIGYYCKPEGPERMCIGWLRAGSAVDADAVRPDIGEAEGVELLEAAARRVPSLQDAHPRGGWASLYDVSPDWQPVIGEIADGVFVDAGTSGHGFKLAPALGSHVADMLTGSADPRLAQFSPARFAAGAGLAAGYGGARILG